MGAPTTYHHLSPTQTFYLYARHRQTRPLFPRDVVLLKSGSWSKKIDVEKASNGDEISVNLISSEYGIYNIYTTHQNVSTVDEVYC